MLSYTAASVREFVLRYLYILVMYLVTPLIVLRLLTRGMRYGNYHRRWPERFGVFEPPAEMPGCLWVHAVSVGEVNAAEPLVKALRADYPHAPLVVTTVTPTGSARVHQLFGDAVFHTVINRTIRFPETTVAGEPITTYDTASAGAAAFRQLAVEVLAKAKQKAGEAGRSRVTASHMPGAALNKAIRKSAPRLFATARQITEDPGYASLRTETRTQLDELLAELKKMEDAGQAAATAE